MGESSVRQRRNFNEITRGEKCIYTIKVLNVLFQESANECTFNDAASIYKAQACCQLLHYRVAAMVVAGLELLV